MRTFIISSIIIISGMLSIVGCQPETVETPEPEISLPPSTPAPMKTEDPIKTEEPMKTEEPSLTEDTLWEEVSFTTKEEITIAGRVFGDGEVAVILAHQGIYPGDQTTWQPFAQLLSDEGLTVLTFDFRGRGQSGGRFAISYIINDLNAAIQFLRDRGFEKIICVGASMGGTACLRAALDHELFGLVVLSSTLTQGEPTSVTIEELTNLSIPKLFITAENDGALVIRDIDAMYENSPEPKEIHIFYGESKHGTDLFNTDVGDELTNLLLTFIKGLVN